MAAEVLEFCTQTGPRVDETTRAGSYCSRVMRRSNPIRSMHVPGYACSETRIDCLMRVVKLCA
jgi:hypothetical protein